MLSESERRTLDHIQTRLSADDPTWVEGFDSTQRLLAVAVSPAWKRALLVAGASLTAALALVVTFAGVLSLTAFFILCTAWFIWTLDRPLRPSDQHAPHPRGDGTS